MKSAFLFMRYFLDESMEMDNTKFKQQISALKNMGYSVSLLGLGLDGVYYLREGSRIKICKLKFQKIPILNKVMQYKSLYYSAVQVMNEVEKVDFSYIRSMNAVPSFIKSVKSINMHSHHTVMEIPTYPIDKEMNSDIRWWRKPMYAIMRYYDKKVSEFIDLYALIGEKCNLYYGKPAINIYNGTLVDDYVKHSPSPPSQRIDILALAKMARWHGYDRLIRGVDEYRKQGGNTPVYIHLVGPDGDGSLAQWKELTVKLGLEEYVVFEGSLYGDELTAMVDRCDIASDALAGFKKGLYFGINLKVAEYCSRGIPFICCKKENDEEFPIPHCLDGIPEDDSPVDISRVVEFVRREQKEKNVTDDLRKYAKSLSWEAQFTKIFDYFEHEQNGVMK